MTWPHESYLFAVLISSSQFSVVTKQNIHCKSLTSKLLWILNPWLNISIKEIRNVRQRSPNIYRKLVYWSNMMDQFDEWIIIHCPRPQLETRSQESGREAFSESQKGPALLCCEHLQRLSSSKRIICVLKFSKGSKHNNVTLIIVSVLFEKLSYNNKT